MGKLLEATHEGILHIGEIAIPCAVLGNGQRVLTQSGVMRALGRARQAKGRQYYDADVNMPAFLTAKNLKPFISRDLEVTSSQIEFRTNKGAKAFGYPAELLPKICDVFLDADEAGVLVHGQKRVVAKVKILVRGLARIGIIALVDEATGYQEIRDKLALQKILDKYLLKEYAKWAKRFPDEFYEQMFRLKGWKWKGMKINRPSVVGKYTNDLVYERLAPKLLIELRRLNPPDESGRRRSKHQQWLTDDVGHPALQRHLAALIALEIVSDNWGMFYRMVQRALPKRGETIPMVFVEK